MCLLGEVIVGLVLSLIGDAGGHGDDVEGEATSHGNVEGGDDGGDLDVGQLVVLAKVSGGGKRRDSPGQRTILLE